MQDEISGSPAPALVFRLDPGERVVAEPGRLAWMAGGVVLRPSAGGTGPLGAFVRALGGGAPSLTEFAAEGEGPSELAFGVRMPGTITKLRLVPGRGFLLHRHGFLCATPGVTVRTGFQRRLGAGPFGDAFLLQRLDGEGDTWVELGGGARERDLGPGEALLAHPGHVGIFDQGMRFEVQAMRGARSAALGRDGLSLVRFTGPGRVWLQTATLPALARSLAPYLPRGKA